jgi:hypothetical protein
VAYDLALRRQIARDVSRGDEAARPPGRGALRAAAAGLALLLPYLTRGAVVTRYRREYRRDARGRDLARTQEMPAISSTELVYGRED